MARHRETDSYLSPPTSAERAILDRVQFKPWPFNVPPDVICVDVRFAATLLDQCGEESAAARLRLLMQWLLARAELDNHGTLLTNAGATMSKTLQERLDTYAKNDVIFEECVIFQRKGETDSMFEISDGTKVRLSGYVIIPIEDYGKPLPTHELIAEPGQGEDAT